MSAPPTPSAHTAPGVRANGADPIVTVENLGVAARGRPLVADVSLTIGAGQRVGLIGSSGSGKTLTASVIAGLVPPDLDVSGSVRFPSARLDVVVAGERALAQLRGREVGMVFQEPLTALNPTMRVGRQIGEALALHDRHAPRGPRSERVDGLLAEVGLADIAQVARRYPHELSGGQRQRVALAIALANRPRLLICDEPTTALDVRTQARMLDLIESRVAASRAALLFISHDIAVVAGLCDDLLVMWQGRIVERGPAVDVITHPQHEHTRQLVAASRALGQWAGSDRGPAS